MRARIDSINAMSSENAIEFEHVRLTPYARRRALYVRSIIHDATQYVEGIEEDIIALVEGGMSLNFENDKTRREIVLVLPPDGEVLYFIARGTDRFRRAGIVIRDAAIPDLARWASDQAEFSSRDLDVSDAHTQG